MGLLAFKLFAGVFLLFASPTLRGPATLRLLRAGRQQLDTAEARSGSTRNTWGV